MSEIKNLDRLARAGTERRRYEDAVLHILRGHERDMLFPTNLRFLFYEGEMEGLFTKKTLKLDGTPSTRTDGQYISEAVTRLVEREVIPSRWIVDETRPFHSYNSYYEPQEAALAAVERDWWHPWEDVTPMVLMESRSLQGVLRSILMRYKVDHAALNGQAGRSQIDNDLTRHLHSDTPVWLLVDKDKSGGDIETSLGDRIEARKGFRPVFERIAITDDQVAVLESAGRTPVEKTDGRTGKTELAWETESLGQGEVQRIVETFLTDKSGYTPQEVLDEGEALSEDLREYLDGFETWKASR